jgi:protein-tyrosine phosphatase
VWGWIEGETEGGIRAPNVQQNGGMSFAPDSPGAHPQASVTPDAPLPEPLDGDAAVRFRICFVCSGNICRSPIAEVVLRRLAEEAGLADRLSISSAGTGDWHVGEQADPRALDVLHAHGYDGATHRARQFDPGWFDDLDLVVALDRSHERILKNWATNEVDRSKVQLLRSFETPRSDSVDVPDPYYSDHALFAAVLGMIERADRALLDQLAPALRLPAPATARGGAAAQDAEPTRRPEPARRPEPTPTRPLRHVQVQLPGFPSTADQEQGQGKP